jgi:hypothetical protein
MRALSIFASQRFRSAFGAGIALGLSFLAAANATTVPHVPGKSRRGPEWRVVIDAIRFRLRARRLTAFTFALILLAADGARAQTAADVSAAVGNVCAVLSGQQKADSRTLQYLLLMDEDFADANPVSIAIFRGVTHQCPKAYLAYEQRKRTHNPFANSGLTNSTPTQLTAAPKTFALRCRGGHGIASAQGATLIVVFAKATHPAAHGLLPGQCSWADRAVSAKESARIVVPLANAAQARDGVAQINAGGLWTFQTYNANGSLRATAVAKGVTSTR